LIILIVWEIAKIFSLTPSRLLIPDGSARMELAKKILLNEIIQTVDFATKYNN